MDTSTSALLLATIPDDTWLLATDAEDPWIAYLGPHGGKGWQHAGNPSDIRYQVEKPGAHEGVYEARERAAKPPADPAKRGASATVAEDLKELGNDFASAIDVIPEEQREDAAELVRQKADDIVENQKERFWKGFQEVLDHDIASFAEFNAGATVERMKEMAGAEIERYQKDMDELGEELTGKMDAVYNATERWLTWLANWNDEDEADGVYEDDSPEDDLDEAIADLKDFAEDGFRHAYATQHGYAGKSVYDACVDYRQNEASEAAEELNKTDSYQDSHAEAVGAAEEYNQGFAADDSDWQVYYDAEEDTWHYRDLSEETSDILEELNDPDIYGDDPEHAAKDAAEHMKTLTAPGDPRRLYKNGDEWFFAVPDAKPAVEMATLADLRPSTAPWLGYELGVGEWTQFTSRSGKPGWEKDGERRYQAKKPVARGGVQRQGKVMREGQWVESAAAAAAPPAVAPEPAAAVEKQPKSPRKKAKADARQARGPVDVAALRASLAEHDHHELSPAEVTQAQQAMGQLRRHHGDEAWHRVEELIGDVREAMGKIRKSAKNGAQLRAEFGRRLRVYGEMLGTGGEKKAPDELPVETPPLSVAEEKAKEPWASRVADFEQGARTTPEMYDGLETKVGGKLSVKRNDDGTFNVIHQFNGQGLPLATGAHESTALQMSMRSYGRTLNNEAGDLVGQHRKVVTEALVAGKRVPPEVLADYPDLAAKYGDKSVTVPAIIPEKVTVDELARRRAEDAKWATADKPPVAPEPNFTGSVVGTDGKTYHFVDGKPVAGPEEVEAAREAASPREVAKQAIKEAAESDYAFARDSAVPNAGEDILGSARHTRNAWRGLEDAEKNGTAANMITRTQLFKSEPSDLHAGVEAGNSLTALAMHLALNKFPAEPMRANDTKYYKKPEMQIEARRWFYESYQMAKRTAEELAKTEPDPKKALESFRETMQKRFRELRSITGELPGLTLGESRGLRSAVSNTYVKFLNSNSSYTRAAGKNGTINQLGDFAKRLSAAYGGIEVGKVDLEKIASHVQDVLEGESFNKTFGTVGEKAKGFNPADMYVKRAERKGGRVIDANTVEAGRKFMLDSLKMRGVQFGNSMTDEERQHHLKYASEAFADLADVTGLPDSAISMNGELGIAFGARGKGAALAHYEPTLRVINLTRKNGVGSLAHEWGHFFDNMLARAAGGGDDKFMTSNTGEYHVAQNPVEEAFVKFHEALRPFRRRLAKHIRENVRDLRLTPQKAGYYMSTVEVFARSFEKHVQHKLQSQGRENSYLAGLNKEGISEVAMGLWPTEEETKAMVPAFDGIFKAYREAMKQ